MTLSEDFPNLEKALASQPRKIKKADQGAIPQRIVEEISTARATLSAAATESPATTENIDIPVRHSDPVTKWQKDANIPAGVKLVRGGDTEQKPEIDGFAARMERELLLASGKKTVRLNGGLTEDPNLSEELCGLLASIAERLGMATKDVTLELTGWREVLTKELGNVIECLADRKEALRQAVAEGLQVRVDVKNVRPGSMLDGHPHSSGKCTFEDPLRCRDHSTGQLVRYAWMNSVMEGLPIVCGTRFTNYTVFEVNADAEGGTITILGEKIDGQLIKPSECDRKTKLEHKKMIDDARRAVLGK